MKIEISQEDYEFLKDLQNELKTQDTDCQAQPVYWGVIEDKEEFRGTDGDYGGVPYIGFDDGRWTVEEAVEQIEEQLNSIFYDYGDDFKTKWEEVDKTSAEDLYDFMVDELKWNNVYGVFYYEKVQRLSDDTGAFLTKRACKNYIEKFGYNHNNPHTYGMTAYRNFELERLLKILREMKMD